MKQGDLVKHKEDEVFGVVMGPGHVWDVSPNGKPDTRAPRFTIHWFDMSSSCDESQEDFVVVSEVDKDEKIC